MSSIINKRQQARNERILQDLLKSVAGNDRCADCGTKNPGIFLCIRCASLHRKLGTHISKVKSISMDSWTNDQIDNMRTNGNTKSNTYYNPDPSKHSAPLSSEDSVGVLERYIRNKYEYQLFRRGVDARQASSTSSVSSGASSSFGATANNSGISLPSSSSSNASFNPGQRSVSAGYASSRLGSISASPGQHKASQVLGMNTYADGGAPIVQFPHGMVQASPTMKYEDQIKSLRDMGFKDDNQILQVLILTEGKILDSVDHLVRLNGGSHPRPATANGGGAGIMIQKPDGNQNPFEALDRELPPLPPGAVEVGGLSPGLRPTIYSTRDLSIQQQQLPQSAPPTSYGTDGVDGWFQVPQQPQQQQMQNTGYQQQGMVSGHKTGPQMSTANPYYGGGGGGVGMFTTATPMNGTGMGSYNPFMNNSVPPGHNPYSPPTQQNQQAQLQQQQVQHQQQYAQQQQQQLQQQQYVQQQQLQQALQQQQQLEAQQQQAQQAQQTQQALQQAQQQAQQQLEAQQQQALQHHYQSQLQPQQQIPFQNTMYTAAPANPYHLPLAAPQPNPYQSQLLQQRTGGVDKSAILALFNYPHLAPPPNNNPVNLSQQQENNLPVPGHMERSMSAPSAGSNNPFLPPMQGLPMSQSSLNLTGQAGMVGQGVRGGSVTGQGGRGHMSQESVDFGAWQTGRHSPDAFASLSFGQ